jgi:hypothetical protein
MESDKVFIIDSEIYRLVKHNIATILKNSSTLSISEKILYDELPFEFMRLKNVVNTILYTTTIEDIVDKLNFFLGNIRLSNILTHSGVLEVKDISASSEKSERGSIQSRCERLKNRLDKKEIVDFEYLVKWFGDIDIYRAILLISSKQFDLDLKIRKDFKDYSDENTVNDFKLYRKIVDEVEKIDDSLTEIDYNFITTKKSRLERIIESFLVNPDENKSIVKLLSTIKISDLLKFSGKYYSNIDFKTISTNPDDLSEMVATDILRLIIMNKHGKLITVKHLVQTFGKYDLRVIMAIICNIFVLEL